LVLLEEELRLLSSLTKDDYANMEAGSSSKLIYNNSSNNNNEGTKDRKLLILRLKHAGLNGLIYALALLLMLVGMTYNPNLFLSLTLGYITGDFFFAYHSLTSNTGKNAVGQPDCH